MKLKTLLTTVGAGAALMYFLDPQLGNRRRALVRDRFNSLVNNFDNSIDAMLQDTRNRARGILSEMTARLSDQDSPDWLLEERVRAALGRATRHSRLLEIRSNGGHVLISGPALRSEKEEIIKFASQARGVHSVQDEMQVVEKEKDLPSLQIPNTGAYTYTGHPQPRQNWSPAMRLVSGVGGSLLTLYGMKRSGFSKPLLSTAGLLLTTRSLVNKDTKSMLGMGTAENGFKVRKAININAPIDEVYQFWHNFENFSLFMEHVKQVSVQDGVSTWRVAGPAGTAIEFQAHTTMDIPNELISWETSPDSQVQHKGFVRFDQNREGGIRVSVQMEYLPPAGVVGHAIAQLFGVDPRHALNEDLVRLKSLLEQGRTSTSTGTAILSDEEDIGTNMTDPGSTL
jgi:uncharacterized membrane protein